jgi:hypothetical protein
MRRISVHNSQYDVNKRNKAVHLGCSEYLYDVELLALVTALIREATKNQHFRRDIILP